MVLYYVELRLKNAYFCIKITKFIFIHKAELTFAWQNSIIKKEWAKILKIYKSVKALLDKKL